MKGLLNNRIQIWDAIWPPFGFLLLLLIWDLPTAVLLSIAGCLLLLFYRLLRSQSPRQALGGLAAFLLAAGLVYLLDSENGIILPGIFSSAITLLIAFLSILMKRPLVAWTSFLAHRWPWQWYWHPRVRPAYMEVTWFWAVYFLLRLLIQMLFFTRGNISSLATLNFILSWPATLLLLAASYLYGTYRLRTLGGPSVHEFLADAPPPWQSQQRGF